MLPRTVWLVFFLALPGAGPQAQDHDPPAPIHRCTDANGQTVYTDRDCADIQATPSASASAATATAAPASSAPAPPILCAADVGAMQRAIADAFAARDPTRMTGLMLWTGYSKSTLLDNVRKLTSLIAQPLLAVDVEQAATDGPRTDPTDTLESAAPANDRDAIPSALILRTGDEANDNQIRFELHQRSGCLWLQPL